MKSYKSILSLIVLSVLFVGVFSHLSFADSLDNWHVRDNPAQSGTLNAITYGNGLFVAVGDNGTILTSTDGIIWAAGNSGTRVSLRGITYGNGTFIAVGSPGTIITSPDGVNWTIRQFGTYYGFDGVIYGNGTFLALRNPGTTYSSSNGINWSLNNIEGDSGLINGYSDFMFFGLTFGKSNFVIVGGWQDVHVGLPISIEIILTSSDGVNWTQTYSGTYHELHGTTYGNGNFIAVGHSGRIVTSPDSMNWTVRQSGTTELLNAVAYGNGTFVAVGTGGTILQSDPLSGNCTATSSNDLSLNVPILIYHGQPFWADFQGDPNSLDIQLTNFGLLPDLGPFGGCQPSLLSPDLILHIPTILFDGVPFLADFQYSHDLLLHLTGAGQRTGNTTPYQVSHHGNLI